MTLTELTYYFQQKHQLIDNQKYYLKLSMIVGLVLTIFVYIFDPYDNHLAVPKFEIPIKIIQLGYGIITASVIYGLYWLLFRKLQIAKGKHTWKTYHHWLLLVAILSIAGFIGTIYHRFMMDVGEVDTQYYMFVTIPRSIMIAIPLFVITILLDRLYTSQNTVDENKKSLQNKVQEVSSSEKKVILKSPAVNQCIEVIPSTIEYIKASGNYVEIYATGDQKAQLLRASLRFVAEQLETYAFLVQCHRQYFINIQKIQSHRRNSQRILLDLETTPIEIPVSKSYVKKILSYINKRKI
ncbi:MAG: LytTR family transcriptional regulator DNA-binding domain-containing protein [Bacteroidota bacterium]